MTRKNDRRKLEQAPGHNDARLGIEVGRWLASEARAESDAGSAATERALRRVFQHLPTPSPGAGFAARVMVAAVPTLRGTRSRRWLLIAAAIVAVISLPLRVSLAVGALTLLDTSGLVGLIATILSQAEHAMQQVGALVRVMAELGPTFLSLFWSPPTLVVLAILASVTAFGVRRLGAPTQQPEVGLNA